MDRSPNLARFYHGRYDHALQAWKDGEKDEAEDICRILVAEYGCPPLIRVQAWQLRSLCTSFYYDARSHLQACFPVMKDVDVDEGDETIAGMQTHTQRMIDELDKMWFKQWEAKDEVPPTKEELEQEELDAQHAEEEEDQRIIGELAAYDRARGVMSDEMVQDPTNVPIAAARAETPPTFGPHLPGFVTADKWYSSGIGYIPPLKVPDVTVEELDREEDWARDQAEQELEDMELAMKAAEQHMKELRLQKGDGSSDQPEAMEGIEEEESRVDTQAPLSPAESEESL